MCTLTMHAHKKRNMKRLNLLASRYVGGLKKQKNNSKLKAFVICTPMTQDKRAGHCMLSAITCVGKRLDSAE